MTKYEQDRQEAYDALLEDGVMGQVRLSAATAEYDPETSAAAVVSADGVGVPMLRGELSVSVRYMGGSLISDKDIRLYLAALDDQGQPFGLAMEHEITFNGELYTPRGFEAVAPDGEPVMYDAVVSRL